MCVYCVCVAQMYEKEPDGCQGVKYHSDTLPVRASDWPKMPYVPGAGVIVVSYGMSQLLYSRLVTSKLFVKPKTSSKVYLKKHSSLPLCYSLSAADKKMVTSTMKKMVGPEAE